MTREPPEPPVADPPGIGGDEAFEVFYHANLDDVWRFVRRRTASPAEADDVTSDVFAVAWRRRADVPADQARLWLFGVARHTLANHHRETSRRRRLHLRVATHDPVPDSYDPALDGTGNRYSHVWAALAALSPSDRELLLLRGWDDLAVTEMGELLGVRPAVVSSRLHKARARLARELDRRDPDRDGHVPGDPRLERSTR